MRKKLVFVSLVLFCSLALLQYFSLNRAFDNSSEQTKADQKPMLNVQPVNQVNVYYYDDYFVIYQDGKYVVYPSQKKSI
jgi:hypothetical protein